MRNKLWGLGFFVILLAAVIMLNGCVLTDSTGNKVRISIDENNRMGAVTQVENVGIVEKTLRAMVKGSIYESGEAVSVFGACLDSNDAPFPNTYATFDAWYPNGTMFIINESLPAIQDGYYLYTAPMASVQGTYLTQITCRVNGSDEIARAQGEWQNPYWVKRIALLNDTLNNLTVSLENISFDFGNISFDFGNISFNETNILNAIANQTENFTISIGNMQQNMTDSFEITWDKIESVNTTITNVNTSLYEQLIYVAGVANGSVDRNDSYVVELLWNIIFGVAAINETINDNTLTLAEYPDDRIVFYKNWNIYVEVYNTNGIQIGWPLVGCYISTVNLPNSTNVLMVAQRNNNDNPIFTHTEKVRVLDGFNWSVNCEYN